MRGPDGAEPAVGPTGRKLSQVPECGAYGIMPVVVPVVPVEPGVPVDPDVPVVPGTPVLGVPL